MYEPIDLSHIPKHIALAFTSIVSIICVGVLVYNYFPQEDKNLMYIGLKTVEIVADRTGVEPKSIDYTREGVLAVYESDKSPKYIKDDSFKKVNRLTLLFKGDRKGIKLLHKWGEDTLAETVVNSDKEIDIATLYVKGFKAIAEKKE